MSCVLMSAAARAVDMGKLPSTRVGILPGASFGVLRVDVGRCQGGGHGKAAIDAGAHPSPWGCACCVRVR